MERLGRITKDRWRVIELIFMWRGYDEPKGKKDPPITTL